MTAIRFEVPYFFDATYVPPRKRNPVKSVFGGTMPIEIESLSSDEAPVAVTITRDDGVDTWTRDIRAFNGKFYSDAKDFNWRAAQETVSVDEFQPVHLEIYDTDDLEVYEAGNLTETPEGEFYSIEGYYDEERQGAAIESKKDAIVDAASKVIFVDGRLHRQCALPTISARIEYRTHLDPISIDLGRSNEETGAHGMMFSIEDHAAALSWARDRHSRERGAEIYDYISIEVHHAHLLPREDVIVDEALRVVKFILDKDSADLKEQSDEYLTNFMVARRAYRTACSKRSEEAVTEMLEVWKIFREGYAVEENERRMRYSSSYDLEDDIYYKALMGVSAVWENRPIMDETSDMAIVPGPRA